jgi:GntR family transcriptional regulator/MocR family aminotransferase
MYLELDGRGPRYLQLIRALKASILSGRIPAGERLPATRTLARELGVSRNTVLVAYEQIVAEGFADGRVGAGTYVAELGVRRTPQRRLDEVHAQPRYVRRARTTERRDYTHLHADLPYDLQYGAPLVNPTIAGAWRRELGRAAGQQSPDYPGARGLRALREAIAAYLARRRGLQVRRQDIVVVRCCTRALAPGRVGSAAPASRWSSSHSWLR